MLFLLISAALLGAVLALIVNLIYLIVLGIGKLASFLVKEVEISSPALPAGFFLWLSECIAVLR